MTGDQSAATFFESREAFRRWLEENHDTAAELWIGYYKKSSGRGGLSYAEAVEEALCFGWIDGKARTLDEHSYANRYTPRRKGSNWSELNVQRVASLTAEGRMHPSGMRAFEARQEDRTGVYSYENRPADLPPELAAEFRRHSSAWEYFAAQTPAYRRNATWWVVSAKRPETQQRRLSQLIELSAAGRRLDQLSPPGDRASIVSE